jgi:ABC-type cobalamin/Fe3+-siderophores transport system ATPase subunit
MEEILKTESLQAGYGKGIVVGDVNISLEPGEVLVLVGPNGSGKSTILKTITRQLSKLGGTVLLGKSDLQELSGDEIARMMSLVTTQRLHPEWMSCREMVSTGRYPYTGQLGILGDSDWKKVDEAIELVRAEDIAEANYNQISDGQRQRIMLARALCQEPEVMVLDEPTSFLDIQFKMDILGILRRVAKNRNMGVVMSLHELEYVMAVADQVLCVGDGGIQDHGTPEEVLTGENLEKLFGLPVGSGKPIAQGLREYGGIFREWMK